jgi:hypothetical protein
VWWDISFSFFSLTENKYSGEFGVVLFEGESNEPKKGGNGFFSITKSKTEKI